MACANPTSQANAIPKFNVQPLDLQGQAAGLLLRTLSCSPAGPAADGAGGCTFAVCLLCPWLPFFFRK